ncbi:hypothetical protein AQUCO_01000440v1 [Aquilegia coerulea]|uniref:DNA-directed RNA polymerase III subunit RPC5 n=1 Tax=Aquilegia coerulea TaxID=218851 RepID=A0A2G5E9Y2_AQUCA|nr:hypothetical protein AQUCO_01000440v1 [Aquilegia coerulea]
MDFNDFGPGEEVVSKRVPRTTKFQPKKVPKPEPVTEPIVSTKQEEEREIKPIVIDEAKADEIMAEVEEESKAEPMDEDNNKDEKEEEEDQVIREIDVFLTPSFDNNSQLYVMQYPLRPSWRPYELNERCKEVRIKPKTGKIEVDIHLEKSKNYNKDAADKLKISKQTLSSWKPPLTTSYAIGVLIGNKLHLNPIHAVVQLRPSMEHLMSGVIINGSTENIESTKNFGEATEVKATSSSKKHDKMVKSSTEPVTDAEESWISLAYHGMDSSERNLSTRYRQKMTYQEPSKIQFSMSPDKYADSLCPESSAAFGRDRSLSRKFLLSLPLEERLKKWFSEGSQSQLNHYNYIKHLAPNDSDEEVLECLLHHALLVQGLWVPRTSVLAQLTGLEKLARDFMLLFFKKDIVVTHKQLEEYRHSESFNQALERNLKLIAVHRPSFNDWKLNKPKDESFIRSYPDIERKQEKDWEILENNVMAIVQKSRMTKDSTSSATNNLHSSSGNSDQGAKVCENGTPGSTTKNMSDEAREALPKNMSDEAREALPKALEVILRKHNVCSLQLILEGLQEQAMSKSAGRVEEAVAREAHNALPELQSIIDKLAVNIHGVYVLKSLGDPTLDPLRSAVIALFRGKERNAKVKKAEIAAAAKLQLNRDMNPKEYSQVMSQLCNSARGNAWILKDGFLK